MLCVGMVGPGNLPAVRGLPEAQGEPRPSPVATCSLRPARLGFPLPGVGSSLWAHLLSRGLLRPGRAGHQLGALRSGLLPRLLAALLSSIGPERLWDLLLRTRCAVLL